MTDENNLLPEEKARKKIDALLKDAGWDVITRNEMTPNHAACAIQEALMKGNLEADYLLFAGGKAIAVLEAKRKENNLETEVQEQAEKYTRSLNSYHQYWFNPLHYSYISNGEKLYFKDLSEPESNYILLEKMHTPKELVSMAEIESEYAKLPAIPEASPSKLRQCQYDAIEKVETEFKNDKSRVLFDLATGSGKTFTACMISYRMLNYTNVLRILYLVDRNNLGRQTESEYRHFKLTESGEIFSNIFSVTRLKKAEDANNTNVSICTIQRLFAVLTGQNFTENDDDADDQSEEDNFFDDDDFDETAVELPSDIKLPKDFFQLIIVDECHRSIYGRWRKVLEYFNEAKIIGLTATPTPQAYAFFECQNEKATFQYSSEESYRDGINVPPRIYRIKTEVTEGGGQIEENEKLIEVSRKSDNRNFIHQGNAEVYTKNQLDRSVVNPTQIKKVVEEYKKIIYTTLFPDRESDFKFIPKTLFFAKTDKHAELIISIIKEVFADKFGGAVPENFVQKITCQAGKSDERIRNFRQEKDFRIAVTVTLVATGTDVRPLEVLVFMRDIHSSVLYTQMKGRGCRSISEYKLREVTPNADTKDCFYLIDAVGVTESEKHIPKVIDTGDGGGDKKLSLEQILERLSFGEITDENLEFLAEKCAFINKRLLEKDKKHLEEFEEIAKISVSKLSENIFEALKNESLPEFVHNGKNIERKNLITKLIDHNDAKEKLLELEKGYYKILLPGKDKITYSGFSLEDAKTHTELFEDFIKNNADEIEALKILYNNSDLAITKSMLDDLQEKLLKVNHDLRTEIIWQDYLILSANNKINKKVLELQTTERKSIVNLIQLVRFAYNKTETLQPIKTIINQRFGLYIGQHRGNVKNEFSNEQIEVLRQIADYVSFKGCFSRSELFDNNKPLCVEAIKIFTPQKIDEELDYYSKFLLGLKAA